MNAIEAMRIWNEHLRHYVGGRGEFRGAARVIGELVAAYDALVPPIEDWPEDMDWFTIDADGAAGWHTIEPFYDIDEWYSDNEVHGAGVFVLPLGIDWRLCEWRRKQTDD